VRKNHDTGILLFVKYPEKGQVKRRLTADLSEEIVQYLYRCFVDDTLAAIKKIDTDLFICFFPVDTEKKFHEWLGSTFSYLPQKGNDLGERMKNCFSDAFTKGFRKVVLMGATAQTFQEFFFKTHLQSYRPMTWFLVHHRMGATISSGLKIQPLPQVYSKKYIGVPQ